MAANLLRAAFFFVLLAREAQAVPARKVSLSPVRKEVKAQRHSQQFWGSSLRQGAKAQPQSSKLVANRKRVVIGLAAVNHVATYTETFVKSLRKTGYDGDIVLGVSAATAWELKQFYADNKVTTANVSLHKCSNSHFNCGDVVVGEHSVETSLNLARFQFYKDAVRGYTGDDLIMLTDVRDVYFQRDPFPVLQEKLDQGMDLFMMEEETETFNNTMGWEHPHRWNFNRGWVWSCWGKEAADALKDKAVTCSGTTMGTANGMARYLNVTLNEIAGRVDAKDKKHCPGWVNKECDCATGGIDQGYHNYLYHTGKFGKTATSFVNGHGPVYTVGIICDNADRVDRGALKLDESGMVTQGHGKETAYAVHQADRCNRPHGWVG